MGPQRADLGNLEFAGNVLEMAVRLQGSGTSTGARLAAIAVDAGIDRRRLLNDILPCLTQLGLIEAVRSPDGVLQIVSERIPPTGQLLQLADSILDVSLPEPVERALLGLLQETARMPLTLDTAIQVGTAFAGENDVRRALRYLQALHLCAIQVSADGDKVVYNPNIWSADVEYAEAALRAEDGTVRAALSGLIEEVAASAGLPQDHVTSTDRQWIDYAVAHNLVQRSIVQTTTGEERAFLFTPHMGRSAFQDMSGADPTGHVRQLIGSMVFAKTYASNKLRTPTAFLRRLIRDGQAGDAPPIATDYSQLELAGIIRVEPAKWFHKFVLLQPQVAEEAISYLDDAGMESGGAFGLRDQRLYRQPEQQRAAVRLEVARTAPTSSDDTARLLAALRQEVGNRRYGR